MEVGAVPNSARYPPDEGSAVGAALVVLDHPMATICPSMARRGLDLSRRLGVRVGCMKPAPGHFASLRCERYTVTICPLGGVTP